MAVLHPFFIHFPIAFIVVAFFFHFIQLVRPYWICRVSPLWLLGLSVLASLLAKFSGGATATNADLNMKLTDETVILLQRHEMFANFTFWGSLIFFIIWLWLFLFRMRDRRVDYMAFIFLLLLSLSVLITGHLGAQLVFIYGVGVGY